MSDIPVIWVNYWQPARDVHPDQPVGLFVFLSTDGIYMRYRGEFYKIDVGSCTNSRSQRQRWCIAGVWFTSDSVAWMLANSIAYPFTNEGHLLYLLTWGDVHA